MVTRKAFGGSSVLERVEEVFRVMLAVALHDGEAIPTRCRRGCDKHGAGWRPDYARHGVGARDHRCCVHDQRTVRTGTMLALGNGWRDPPRRDVFGCER